jgi:hypothetical protein
MVGRVEVCWPGYSASVRNVPPSESTRVCARYRLRRVPYAHEVDHLISLELGGSNSIKNLWPEPYAGTWGARTKDKLENKLHALVCAGKLTLIAAQRAIKTDWVAAYQFYVLKARPKLIVTRPDATDPTSATTDTTSTAGATTGATTIPGSTTTTPVTTPTAPTVSTVTTSPTDPYDPNAFYASSYASASTIYCADDSAWQGLSPTYLQHFATWSEAISARPSYHLHQPC